MKPKITLFVLLAVFFLTSSTPLKDLHLVYVFLGEECTIAQDYTPKLRELHDQYAGKEVQFVGIFPNNYSTTESMKAFKEEHQLPFSVELDKAHLKVYKFKIKYTPEIVVYNVKDQKVVYQGRIDNSYFGLGQKRAVTTTSELADVLQSITEKKDTEFESKRPVGCFLTPIDPLFRDVSPCKESDNPANY
jgi:thiol-disulfide isomerase/thioredoxin